MSITKSKCNLILIYRYSLGVTAFAASNVFQGNDQIRVRPNLGFNFNPQTQSLTPALTANVQVGDGKCPTQYILF